VLIAVLLAGQAPAAPAPAGVARFFEFFTWSPRISPDLRTALDLYQHGRLLEAAAAAQRGLRTPREPWARDELLLIRSLALADLGWTIPAERSFAALLETEEPSPYYPLALLGLVEARHREGRLESVVDAFERYWERPWSSTTRRDRRRQNLLDAYGELRPAGWRLTEGEAALLARPAELAEKLQLRRERASERLLYVCGLDLFRAGEYRRSLDALQRIGMASFYFPYALFTAAQDLYALGRSGEAQDRVGMLLRYPALTEEERALADRAGLLMVEMLFDAGQGDEAVAAARRVSGSGRYALAARLLRAEITLASDKPSVAIAFYGDLQGEALGTRLDAQRAIGLGEAYAKLGDFATAAANLKAASDAIARALDGLDAAQADQRVGELRRLVEADVRANRVEAALRRERIADGVRRVIAFEGPLNLGKIARITFTSHRNTVVGQPVYDLRPLAESGSTSRRSAAGGEGPWLRYLESPSRARIEDAETLRRELAERSDDGQRTLLALDALLGVLEGRFATASEGELLAVQSLVERLSTAVGDAEHATLGGSSVTPAEVTNLRERLLDVLARPSAESVADPVLVADARRAAARCLDDTVTAGLRRVVSSEAEDLRRLQFSLQTELSDAMVGEKGALRPQEIEHGGR
jgi:hypothetical protein